MTSRNKWSAYEKDNPHGSEAYYAYYRVHNYPNWRKRKDAPEIRKAIATAVIHRKRVSFQTQASHRSVEHSPQRTSLIKVTGARPKRQLSPEHRAKLLAVGFQKRQQPTLEAVASERSHSRP